VARAEGLVDIGDGLLTPGLIHVAHDDPRAFFAKAHGSRAPLPAAGSGDNRDPAFETHELIFLKVYAPADWTTF
jgi:hypothetical protein